MALDETMEKILLERNNKVRPTSHELSPVQAREQEKSGDEKFIFFSLFNFL